MKNRPCLFQLILGMIVGGAPLAGAANPYLPLWEYIPDGEPYVFEDPDNLGNRFSGSYIQPLRSVWDGKSDPYGLDVNHNPVVNNTAGSVVGYKYFNFDRLRPALAKTLRPRLWANRLLVRLKPQGVRGRIVIMADHPRHGTRLGVIRLSGREPEKVVEKCARVPRAPQMTGKHALYFVFESDTPDRSLCELEDFVFVRRKH